MGALWKIIGTAAAELAMGIIEALAKGDDWEPLVDKWASEVKTKVAQETHRQETIDALDEMRERILGKDKDTLPPSPYGDDAQ